MSSDPDFIDVWPVSSIIIRGLTLLDRSRLVHVGLDGRFLDATIGYYHYIRSEYSSIFGDEPRGAAFDIMSGSMDGYRGGNYGAVIISGDGGRHMQVAIEGVSSSDALQFVLNVLKVKYIPSAAEVVDFNSYKRENT